MVATAIIGSAVVGAGASLAGSKAQSKSTDKATDVQERMYQQTRADLSPYNVEGTRAVRMLGNRLADLTAVNLPAPIKMDKASLVKTPGYQFNLSQGLKSTQNSAAARGLGNSGAAMKGAASYATGLADSTYQNQFANAVTNQQNQFNNAVTSQTNAYNRLMGVATLGKDAAAQTGSYGTQTAANIGSNTIAGGTATAAGYAGAANAITGGVNNYMTYNALRGMYG